jgi:hypothetical protein
MGLVDAPPTIHFRSKKYGLVSNYEKGIYVFKANPVPVLQDGAIALVRWTGNIASLGHDRIIAVGGFQTCLTHQVRDT